MTTHQQPQTAAPAAMVHPFPAPGPLVREAYRELHVAINGTAEEKQQLGNLALLPRPWEPATCGDPGLREQLWRWLEEVVTWLNHEYSWDVATLVPNCWPRHPHLVHEIAVLADHRRRAGLALTSDALEEWHRYSLPAFLDRMRSRLRTHCDDGHTTWPGRPRHSEHVDNPATSRRDATYRSDLAALPANRRDRNPQAPRRLGLVDLETGEIADDDTSGPQPRTRTEKGPRE